MTADSKAEGMDRRARQLTITQSSCQVLWINNCLQTCKGNHCALVSKNLTTCLRCAMKQKWVQLGIQLREFVNGNEWNKERLYEPVLLLKATQLSGCVVYCGSSVCSHSLSAKWLQWSFRLDGWMAKQLSSILKCEWPWNTAPHINSNSYGRDETSATNIINF